MEEKMNDKKFCFILCTNDELQLEECTLYLSLLHIPEGYETDMITVSDAVSMVLLPIFFDLKLL